MKTKIVTLDQLIQNVSEAKRDGKTVVSTSGCFDIVHAGHVAYLEEARSMGDMLIVLLNSDSSVKRLKGENRPIIPENERAAVLAALETVDYVCIFGSETPCQIIRQLHPDIVVKGGDYVGTHIPEIDVTAEYGGRVKFVSLVQGCSSTNVIEKIKRGIRK